MIAQNNATHLIVGKEVSLATTGARSALTTGQIGIFKNGSGVANADALVSGDGFVASIKDADGNIKSSPFIKYNNIISKSAKTYTAPTLKKVFVGYNGTSGSLAVSNSDVYILRVVLKDNTRAFFEHPLYEYADYNSDASATQEEIALGVLANMVKNFTSAKPRKTPVLAVGLVNSVAGTDTSGGAFTVVNGSPVVTTVESAGAAGDAAEYNTDAAAIVVGDYIRFSAATEALTDEVYKVIAITGAGSAAATITLDRPFAGTSGSKAANTVSVITAAAAAAGNFGLVITALALPFKAGMFSYQVLDFEVLLNEAFGTTITTVATAPSKGTGTYQEVAELEWFLKGNRGETYRVADYPVDNVLAATSGKTYAIVTINYKTDDTKYLDRNIAQTATLMFATETDSTGTPHANLKTVFGIS